MGLWDIALYFPSTTVVWEGFPTQAHHHPSQSRLGWAACNRSEALHGLNLCLVNCDCEVASPGLVATDTLMWEEGSQWCDDKLILLNELLKFLLVWLIQRSHVQLPCSHSEQEIIECILWWHCVYKHQVWVSIYRCDWCCSLVTSSVLLLAPVPKVKISCRH